MASAQSISEFSKCLQVLKSSNADVSIIPTLFTLNGLNPTVGDLNSSRIHVYLAQNVAKRSGITGDLARQLIAKWKRVLPSSASQSPPPSGPSHSMLPTSPSPLCAAPSQLQGVSNRQSASETKIISINSKDSAHCPEPSFKKAKLDSESPADRLQALLEKVTMLRL